MGKCNEKVRKVNWSKKGFAQKSTSFSKNSSCKAQNFLSVHKWKNLRDLYSSKVCHHFNNGNALILKKNIQPCKYAELKNKSQVKPREIKNERELKKLKISVNF